MASMIALFLQSPYHTLLAAAQNTKDATNTNTNNSASAALPTSTAVQKNATAKSIDKATGTNSTGIRGFNSSSPMKNMINPVFKMTRNPIANMTNPLNNTGKQLHLSDLGYSDFSEWFIGHSGSTYWRKKESEKAELFKKVQPYLTFLNIHQLERQGADIQTKVEEIENLNQALRNRDKMKDDAIAQLSDQLLAISTRLQELEETATVCIIIKLIFQADHWNESSRAFVQ